MNSNLKYQLPRLLRLKSNQEFPLQQPSIQNIQEPINKSIQGKQYSVPGNYGFVELEPKEFTSILNKNSSTEDIPPQQNVEPFILEKSIFEDEFKQILPEKQNPEETKVITLYPQKYKRKQSQNNSTLLDNDQDISEMSNKSLANQKRHTDHHHKQHQKLFNKPEEQKKENDRKQKMKVFAMQHEFQKVSKKFDQACFDIENYKSEINNIKQDQKELEKGLVTLKLKLKIDSVDHFVDKMIRDEVDNQIKIDYFMNEEDINEKLDLLYEDNKEIIENYEQLKQEIFEDLRLQHVNAEDEARLLSEQEQQKEQKQLKHILREKIQELQDQNLKLRLKNNLKEIEIREEKHKNQRTKLNNKNRTQSKNVVSKPPKSTSKTQDLYIGYGKSKVKYREV